MTKSVHAQSWYLANLLALPGISFIVLTVLYFKHVLPFQGQIRDALDASFDAAESAQERQRLEKNIPQDDRDIAHIRAAFWLSVFGGGSVFGGSGLLLLLQGNTPNAWMMIVLYFTVIHTSFVLLGILNLARALAQRLPFFKVF